MVLESIYNYRLTARGYINVKLFHSILWEKVCFLFKFGQEPAGPEYLHTAFLQDLCASMSLDNLIKTQLRKKWMPHKYFCINEMISKIK